MRWNQVVKIFVRGQQEGIGGNGSCSNPQIVFSHPTCPEWMGSGMMIKHHIGIDHPGMVDIDHRQGAEGHIKRIALGFSPAIGFSQHPCLGEAHHTNQRAWLTVEQVKGVVNVLPESISTHEMENHAGV